ncbi:MAG: GNAT family N-acetyltransferase [Nanoarchaeota archaeon]|nr:GNAT family N-acetyltransferase [Nanoarchaeota archaeon]
MKIRFGCADDLQFIIAADEETRILEKRVDLKLSSSDIDSIKEEIRKKELLVLEEEGYIIGFISFKSDFEVMGLLDKVFWIDLVFVKKEYRQKGIGRRLYREAFKIAREKGYKKVYAEIYELNKGSKAAHEKMGFKPALTIFEKKI